MDLGDIPVWLEQFHWLRPAWLWALLPLIVLLSLLWRGRGQAGEWREFIAPELLTHLLQDQHSRPDSRLRWWLLGIGWLMAVVAMAGPSWDRLPQPVTQREAAVVVILDLSVSMYAEDIPPSRLVRARHKLLDLLQQQREGLVGLVVYAGDAHVVAPLTDDHATVANLVPALSPEIMPVPGSDPAAAVALGIDLLRRHGLQHGQLLLVSDGVEASSIAAIADQLPAGVRLSILGVGTASGAPVALPDGYLKDADGNIVMARLQREPLRELAQATGGEYRDIDMDDGDLQALLDGHPLTVQRRELTDRDYDVWQDRAPWLAALLLPIAAAAFRRGWLLAVVGLAMLPGGEAQALEWRDLWQRPDQQAAEALRRNQPDAAAELFENPAWRGSAHYLAEDYVAAAEAFAQLDTADAHYNRGNALARAGQLQQAIAAYDQALAADPGLADAAANRELVEQLLQRSAPPPEPQQESQQGSSQSSDDPAGTSPSQPGDKNTDDPGDRQPGRSANRPPTSGDPAEGRSGESSRDPSEAPPGAARPGVDGEQDNARDAVGPGDVPAPDGVQPDSPASQPDDGSPDSPADRGEPPAGTEAGASSPGDPATERWLRQIPDDPAGLLRRKFLYESRLRAEQGASNREGSPR